MKRIWVRVTLVITCLAATVPHGRSSMAEQKSESSPSKRVELDMSGARSSYANFSRVTGTPEELIIEFALNPQPLGVPTEPLHVEHRIVLNFYTAKRLAAALQMSIDRHEQAFGAIETDVEKRLKQKR
jgi:hypothetical protein